MSKTLIKADPQTAPRAGAVSGSRHSLGRLPAGSSLPSRNRCRRRNSIEFHRALYAGRGTIDGQRALALATGEFGLDAQKIVDAANDDGITDIMKSHLRFADRLGLKATPAYLIQDVAIQGHPGRKTLQA